MSDLHPTLTRWREEVAAGTRTQWTFDALWYQAYDEANAVGQAMELETITVRNAGIQAAAIASLRSGQSIVSWGWSDLDRTFGALNPGWLYVVGARPGNGKTTLLLNVLTRLHEDQIPALYFGTEMTPSDSVKKWAALNLGLKELDVFEGRLCAADLARIEGEIERLMGQNVITFSTAPRLDVGRMAAEIAWAFDTRTGPAPRVLILDHLHRITQDREELERLVKELQDVAIERHVAFLVAAQLNRDQAAGQFDLYLPPSLNRYKNSSAIEENVAVALGLFRPLRRGLKASDRRAVERGEMSVADMAEPNTLGLICMKHRYHSPAVGRIQKLVFCGSRLEARSFREPEPGFVPGDAWEPS